MPPSKLPTTHVCLICNFSITHVNAGKLFSTHLRKVHALTTEQYIIDCFHSGSRPVCVSNGCSNPTRFTRDLKDPKNSFKSHCQEHSQEAMHLGGLKGIEHCKNWNKGKTKHSDPRIMATAQRMQGAQNHFYGKHHSAASRDKISKSKTLLSLTVQDRISAHQGFDLVTDPELYFSRQEQYLEVKCLTCGESQFKTLQSIERNSLCIKCFKQMKSKAELEVYDFVKSVCQDAVSGDYSVLGGHKQLDVYVPSKRFAIEYNGLYFHSEREDRNFAKQRHLDKTKLAADKNVQLMHLFSDEWRDKQDVCKSMILQRLGLQTRKTFARKCAVVELSKREQKSFFDDNHIAGSTSCRIAFGLKFGDELVAALSLRLPRQSMRHESYRECIEIARFCTKAFVSVTGALSKLLKRAETYAQEQRFDSILTYADRRFGTGQGYVKAGFDLLKSTQPDFWYADSQRRFDRFKFRADKKQGLSERQVAQNAKVARIYGCGSFVYLKKLSP